MTTNYKTSVRYTVADIKEANKAGGGCFFGPKEMKIWGDTLASYKVIDHNDRVYLVRVKAAKGFDGKRDNRTIGQIREFYPETGRIGVVLNAEQLAERGL